MSDTFTYTLWRDRKGTQKKTVEGTWPLFCSQLQAIPPAAKKDDCRLIKLATFGQRATEKGCLRHDANVVTVTGIEGDYDAGEMPPEKAIELLESCGLRAAVAPTFSSTPDAPRWRVLLPLAEPIKPAERERYAEIVNGILGGVLAPESAVLSQSYYVGVPAGAGYNVLLTFDNAEEGCTLDELELVQDLEQYRTPFRQQRQEIGVPQPHKRRDAGEYVDLQDQIRSGENYHEALIRLAAKRAYEGMNEQAITAELQALMERSTGPRDERWTDRYNDIPRTVRGAMKFQREDRGSDIAALFDWLEESKPDAGWQIVPYGLETEPDLSHDNLALELSKAGFKKDARYVCKWGKWLFWSGSRWEIDERLLHMTVTRDFLRAKAQKVIEWGNKKAGVAESPQQAEKVLKWARDNAKTLRQANSVASVESMARSNADLVATVEQFDSDLMLLGTPGGTVDLKTGKLLPADRGHWITKHCAVTPADPGEPAPLWDAFLQRVFDGNQELIDFLQRAAGYALTGHTTEHKLLFLYGTGRNGKSVFLNTLYDIMGDYAKRAPAQTFLDSGSDRHPTDLAGLMGARLVAGSELPAGKAWNESVIKDLTGGDVITARFMRQDFFEYVPQFTLFIAGNHQPSFRGIDEAIRARVVLVPFTQTIPKEERDPELPQKLREEWPAILRWMIDGAVKWQQEGLNVPEAVQAASNEYLESEDALGEFISEHLCTQGGSVKTADLFERFEAWQKSCGLSQTWTKTAMTRAFRERGFEYAKLSGGARGFRGIKLKPAPEFDDVSGWGG